MKGAVSYKSLRVFQKAHQLVIFVYQVTKHFPRDELFGLISQIRRATVSGVANIVEGYGRETTKSKLYFFNISRASLREVEYYLDLSLELQYLGADEYAKLKEIHEDTIRLLNGFITSYRK